MVKESDGASNAQEVEFVKWFSELSNKDVSIAGGKGASLAEMYNAKMPIPPGFVITAQAFDYFTKKTKLDVRIKNILSKLDIENTESLRKVSDQIREMIEKESLPSELEEAILESYEILADSSSKQGDALSVVQAKNYPFVAVRSSATTEDLAEASFAGQQDSFLNVRGKDELLLYVKKCMSSLFTARAIYYRVKQGFKDVQAYLAVVVMKMVNSDKSGVMFTKNPTKNDNSVVIEAVGGLGEGIVSGKIKPDHYEVSGDLEDFEIKETSVVDKKIAIVKNADGKNETITLPPEKSTRQVLNNYEIKRLAQYGKQLEEHYGKPQDIEFAIESESIMIVQSRPITTLGNLGAKKGPEVKGNVLLKGLGASPGVSSGVVKIVS
jgi:pyruvate,water dikinase